MPSCRHCRAEVAPEDLACKHCGRLLASSTKPPRDEDDDDLPEEQDPPSALIGKTIAGNYEILEHIGEGAMGRVYKARQKSLDKPVAIKVLHARLVADPRVAKRFHREARAASRLSHPNSLQIIDFGADEDGTLYIAMELLEGRDLQAIIEDDGPLTPARIANLLRQVLSALDEAHHAGIIHRDLKPENVIVVKGRTPTDERVKVCDFGIAKIQDATGSGSAITMSGFVCGTPEYMSPEQARGEELDARADVYAVGVILYQMLVGRVPFTAENALGIITKQLTEVAVSPRKARPEMNIPPSLEAVCLKAMSKDRQQRYASAGEMADALTKAVAVLGEDAELPIGKSTRTYPDEIESEDLGPTVVGRTRSSVPAKPEAEAKAGWPVIAAVVGAIVIAGVLAWRWLAASGPTDVPQVAQVERPITHPEEPTPGVDAGVTLIVPVEDDDAGPAGAVEPPRGHHGGRDTSHDHSPTPTLSSPEPGHEAPPPSAAPSSAPRSPGQLAYDEGHRLFLANDIPGAISHFNEAARLMPGDANVQKQLGRSYMRSSDPADHRRAIEAYRHYLQLAPNAADREATERLIAEGGG